MVMTYTPDGNPESAGAPRPSSIIAPLMAVTVWEMISDLSDKISLTPLAIIASFG